MSDGWRSMMRATVAAAIAAGLLGAGVLPAAAQQPVDPALYSGLHWRMIGPFRAGRVNAVSGVPGKPTTFYFGSVGGGVWRTDNAGRTWRPIFDSQPVGSIGAIAVAPSRPEVVYVGTGEADMRSQNSFGNGMYRSTDGGATWSHIGLEATRHIGRVLVDPDDPDTVFVAALGHIYGANPERGVFRSRDGGEHWQKVLFEGGDVGAIDLAFDPRDSSVVYAALWNTRRPPWSIYPPSYGPGSGLFKSTDGGDTWQQLGNGLPSAGLGRIGVAVAPSERQRVYAIVDAAEGGLYRSDDAGATWTRVGDDERIWGRGWYFSRVTVDPEDPDVVYVSNTSLYRSTDGGTSFTAIKGAPGGDDYRQLWIEPDDPQRMILASDQGAIVSVDGARSWSTWYNQPTAQLYHVAADTRFPYWVLGAQQDSGAVGVPSRSDQSEISNRDWRGLCAGGEAGYTAPDPLHPEILFGGRVTRCNVLTGETVDVSPERDLDVEARHTWTLPLVFSQADPRALYFADQFLFRTTDGGDSWDRISPDLTREDPGVPPNLDAATAADAPEGKRRGVIYTIAPSPLRASRIWAGTDDGLVHRTDDGGETWSDVTPLELTPWSKVVMMDASHFDVDEAFAAVDRHRLDDPEPYIYRTRDAGATWRRITDGLPAGAWVQTVKEDPERPGLLFAGTELAVFVSFDDGDHWQSLQLNLPPVSMRDLAIHEDDLIVATHGRGFWVLDGIGPLRQIDDAAGTGAYLFRSADAIELPPSTDHGTPQPRDEPLAANPPDGAAIDYWLQGDAVGPVRLEIRDPAGAVIRTFTSADPTPTVDPDELVFPAYWVSQPVALPATAGMHRWIWDLRPEPPQQEAAESGGFRRRRVPRVLPGRYTVWLSVDGHTYKQPLRVLRDPRGS